MSILDLQGKSKQIGKAIRDIAQKGRKQDTVSEIPERKNAPANSPAAFDLGILINTAVITDGQTGDHMQIPEPQTTTKPYISLTIPAFTPSPGVGVMIDTSAFEAVKLIDEMPKSEGVWAPAEGTGFSKDTDGSVPVASRITPEGTYLNGYDREGFDREGYDRAGFNKAGFDRDGFDVAGFNQEGFDREGYDLAGFNLEGFNREGYNQFGFDKVGFGRDGYDKNGFNQDGFGRDGYDKAGFDKDGFDREGYDKAGFSKEGFNREGFDKAGFNQDGFDKEGYDEAGFNQAGFNREGFNKAGFNLDGFDKKGYDEAGFNKAGFDREGYNKVGFNQDGFDKEGYDKAGFSREGFDREGYDLAGFNKENFNREGYDKTGFDKDGFGRDGYDKNGFNKEGFGRDGYGRTGFDKEGFGRDGYDENGFNKKGFGRDGYDKNGFNQEGFDREGFDKTGFDQVGLDREGFDKAGFNQEGFDREGFDKEGYNNAGYNREGFDREGYDTDGLNKAGFYIEVLSNYEGEAELDLNKFDVGQNNFTEDQYQGVLMGNLQDGNNTVIDEVLGYWKKLISMQKVVDLAGIGENRHPDVNKAIQEIKYVMQADNADMHGNAECISKVIDNGVMVDFTAEIDFFEEKPWYEDMDAAFRAQPNSIHEAAASRDLEENNARLGMGERVAIGEATGGASECVMTVAEAMSQIMGGIELKQPGADEDVEANDIIMPVESVSGYFEAASKIAFKEMLCRYPSLVNKIADTIENEGIPETMPDNLGSVQVCD